MISINQLPASVRQLIEASRDPTSNAQARSNAKQMLEAIVIKATEAIDAFNLAEAKQPKAPYVQRKQGIRSAHFD